MVYSTQPSLKKNPCCDRDPPPLSLCVIFALRHRSDVEIDLLVMDRKSFSSDFPAVQSHVWHVREHIALSVWPVTLCEDTDKELLWKREGEAALTSSMAACVCLCACGGSSICPIKPPYCCILPLSVSPLCACACACSHPYVGKWGSLFVSL